MLKDEKKLDKIQIAQTILDKTGRKKPEDSQDTKKDISTITIAEYCKKMARAAMRHPSSEVRTQLEDLHVRLKELLLPLSDASLIWILGGSKISHGRFTIKSLKTFLNKDCKDISSSRLISGIETLLCDIAYRAIRVPWSTPPIQPDTPDLSETCTNLWSLIYKYLAPPINMICPRNLDVVEDGSSAEIKIDPDDLSDVSDTEDELKRSTEVLPGCGMRSVIVESTRKTKIKSWVQTAIDNGIPIRSHVSSTLALELAVVMGLFHTGTTNTWADSDENLSKLAAVLMAHFLRGSFHSFAESSVGVHHYLSHRKRKHDPSLAMTIPSPRDALETALSMLASAVSNDVADESSMSLREAINILKPVIMASTVVSFQSIDISTIEDELKPIKTEITEISAKIEGLIAKDQETTTEAKGSSLDKISGIEYTFTQVSDLKPKLKEAKEQLLRWRYVTNLYSTQDQVWRDAQVEQRILLSQCTKPEKLISKKEADFKQYKSAVEEYNKLDQNIERIKEDLCNITDYKEIKSADEIKTSLEQLEQLESQLKIARYHIEKLDRSETKPLIATEIKTAQTRLEKINQGITERAQTFKQVESYLLTLTTLIQKLESSHNQIREHKPIDPSQSTAEKNRKESLFYVSFGEQKEIFRLEYNQLKSNELSQIPVCKKQLEIINQLQADIEKDLTLKKNEWKSRLKAMKDIKLTASLKGKLSGLKIKLPEKLVRNLETMVEEKTTAHDKIKKIENTILGDEYFTNSVISLVRLRQLLCHDSNINYSKSLRVDSEIILELIHDVSFWNTHTWFFSRPATIEKTVIEHHTHPEQDIFSILKRNVSQAGNNMFRNRKTQHLYDAIMKSNNAKELVDNLLSNQFMQEYVEYYNRSIQPVRVNR